MFAIKKTGKKGRGVFASRNIKKGETIIKIKHTKLISRRDVSKFSYYYQNHMGYVGNDKYAIFKSPEKYINHSCDPNAYFKHINPFNEHVVSIKNIKKGEEIVCDYTIDSGDNWIMKCRCGSKNCRKTIRGSFESLDKKTQKKYLPYLPFWSSGRELK